MAHNHNDAPDDLSREFGDRSQDSQITHPHSHSHSHSHYGTSGDIKSAFFLNLIFTVIEIIGGIYTNSIAIMTDAIHDLGDSLSLGLAWYFERFSKKKKTASYSYGFKRFSLVGAIINSTVLIVGSIIILREAIPRFINPQSVKVEGMFILALLGILFNGLAVWRLRDKKSINQRVVYLHLLEDVLGWVAVLIGAIVMYFFDAPFIDPLLSVLIALFILYNAIKNIRAMISIVMQGTPTDINLDSIKIYLSKLPGIIDFHDLHVWTMDGEYHVLTVHLVFDPPLEKDRATNLKSKIRKDLQDRGIAHATLEFEGKDEDCVLVDC